jgi:hypothetical protein
MMAVLQRRCGSSSQDVGGLPTGANGTLPPPPLSSVVQAPGHVQTPSHTKVLCCVLAAMSLPQDVAEQQHRIGAANKGQFVYPGYGHMDFIW